MLVDSVLYGSEEFWRTGVIGWAEEEYTRMFECVKGRITGICWFLADEIMKTGLLFHGRIHESTSFLMTNIIRFHPHLDRSLWVNHAPRM